MIVAHYLHIKNVKNEIRIHFSGDFETERSIFSSTIENNVQINVTIFNMSIKSTISLLHELDTNLISKHVTNSSRLTFTSM